MVSRQWLLVTLRLSALALVAAHPGPHLLEREIAVTDDNGPTNGQLCGIQNSNTRCDDGWCCGPDGICGQGGYYCAGPASQFQFSSASDANTVPSGPNTDSISRPRFGHVPYGSVITSCYDPGVVALTFDDGPYSYTSELLDYLKRMKVNATFFVTGGSGGKGSIGDSNNQYYNDIARMLAEGHQIASHTWTHQDLSLIGHDHRIQQITKNERAIANNIGLIPTYIRPPYLSCDDACQVDLADLGYHIVNIDLDTNDWMMNYTAAVDYYNMGIDKDPAAYGWNVLAHDIHAYTVRQLVPYMVEKLFARGYKPVTIGECLHDDPKNWYRHPVTGEAAGPARAAGILPVKSGSPSSTAQSCQPTGTVRTDGRCGRDFEGAVCGKGLCCSEWGWCNSDIGCGTGCQVGFGACDNTFYPCSSITGSMSSSRPTSTSSVANCQPTGTVRTDGRCGKDFDGAVCGTGYCCSEWGWCDNTATFCGAGCQIGYGLCTGHVYSCPASASVASSTISSSFATSITASSSITSSSYSSSISKVVSSSIVSNSPSSSIKPSSSIASSAIYSSSISSSIKASPSLTSSSVSSPSVSSSIEHSSLTVSASVATSSGYSSSLWSSFKSSSPFSSSTLSSSTVQSSLETSSDKQSSNATRAYIYPSSISSFEKPVSSVASSSVPSSSLSFSASSSYGSSGASSSAALSGSATRLSSDVISSSAIVASSIAVSSTFSSASQSAVASASASKPEQASASGSASFYSSDLYVSSSIVSSNIGSIATSVSSHAASVSNSSSGSSSLAASVPASSMRPSSAHATSAQSSTAKASSVQRPSNAKSSGARFSSVLASVRPSSATPSARSSPSARPNYSPDGSCGNRSGYTCLSGKCCSQYGWCGVSKDYCGAGCQKQFGSCSDQEGPVVSGKVSTDYTCGGAAGLSCPQSYCCSQYGWCGQSQDYCQAGCQKLFGKCW